MPRLIPPLVMALAGMASPLLLASGPTVLPASAPTAVGEPSRLAVDGSGHLITVDGAPRWLLGEAIWRICVAKTLEEQRGYLFAAPHSARSKGMDLVFISSRGVSAGGSPYVKNAWGKEMFLDGRVDRLNPEYWEPFKAFVEEAEKQDIVVGLLISELARNDLKGYVIKTPEEAYAYGHAVGTFFQAANRNLLWLLGGDCSPKNLDPGVADAIAEGITDGVGGEAAFDGQAAWGTTFMTWHGGIGRPDEHDLLGQAAWNDLRDLYPGWAVVNGKWDVSPYWISPWLTRELRQQRPMRPVLFTEGAYEDRRAALLTIEAWHMRLQAYWGFLSGQAGHVNGVEVLWRCGEAAEWEEDKAMPGRDDYRHVRTLVNLVDLAGFGPDQELLLGVVPAPEELTMENGGAYVAAGCSRAGDVAVVYASSGQTFQVDLRRLGGKRLNAYWFNPREGTWNADGQDGAEQVPFAKDLSTGAEGFAQYFNPPGEPGPDRDWVLLLK